MSEGMVSLSVPPLGRVRSVWGSGLPPCPLRPASRECLGRLRSVVQPPVACGNRPSTHLAGLSLARGLLPLFTMLAVSPAARFLTSGSPLEEWLALLAYLQRRSSADYTNALPWWDAPDEFLPTHLSSSAAANLPPYFFDWLGTILRADFWQPWSIDDPGPINVPRLTLGRRYDIFLAERCRAYRRCGCALE